jgi:Pyridoxamine 5'-phosphate oxidase
MSADPRSRAQHRRDTEHRLTHDIDVWVASASADGAPYLVPLSFDWDGEALLMATPTDSPTGRNLATPNRWFRISPRRIQAWRAVNEIPDRELMRDGRWLV